MNNFAYSRGATFVDNFGLKIFWTLNVFTNVIIKEFKISLVIPKKTFDLFLWQLSHVVSLFCFTEGCMIYLFCRFQRNQASQILLEHNVPYIIGKCFCFTNDLVVYVAVRATGILGPQVDILALMAEGIVTAPGGSFQYPIHKLRKRCTIFVLDQEFQESRFSSI